MAAPNPAAGGDRGNGGVVSRECRRGEELNRRITIAPFGDPVRQAGRVAVDGGVALKGVLEIALSSMGCQFRAAPSKLQHPARNRANP